MILGHSGSGKSYSLRNFEEDEVRVINVASKPFPFRKHLLTLNTDDYEMAIHAIKHPDARAYVVDDANFLMAFESFRKASNKGFDKFVEIACNFKDLLTAANTADRDTITYIMMHPDYDEKGRMKPKSVGKMLDSQLTIESMFTITLLAFQDEDGFHFATKSDGTNPVKSPPGLFDSPIIDNDLKAVDTAIREYYGLKPATDKPTDQEGK